MCLFTCIRARADTFVFLFYYFICFFLSLFVCTHSRGYKYIGTFAPFVLSLFVDIFLMFLSFCVRSCALRNTLCFFVRFYFDFLFILIGLCLHLFVRGRARANKLEIFYFVFIFVCVRSRAHFCLCVRLFLIV